MVENNTEKNYEKKIVCFVDIMGMKSRIDNSKTSTDLQIVYAIQKAFVDNPSVEKDGINIAVFSDCMYIVADKECINHIFEFIAKLSYNFLVNARFNSDGKSRAIDENDCIKVRGGITYGDVLVPYEEKFSKMSNVFMGHAIKEAYILESQKAVYPRIIVDEKILDLLENPEFLKGRKYLTQDNERDFFYFDFLKYIREKELIRDSEIRKCVDFVRSEMEDAIKCADDKLIRKLLWYKRYLERYI